jgi:hypothetical protein
MDTSQNKKTGLDAPLGPNQVEQNSQGLHTTMGLNHGSSSSVPQSGNEQKRGLEMSINTNPQPHQSSVSFPFPSLKQKNRFRGGFRIRPYIPRRAKTPPITGEYTSPDPETSPEVGFSPTSL